MKRLAELVARSLDDLGLLSTLEWLERRRHRLRVITYHRVAEPDDEPDLEPGLISATPAEFARQMNLLASRYTPISLQKLLEAYEQDTPLPERAVLVTFDDGYQDFARNAWPVMRTLGVPATLFVPTAFPDGPAQGFWWDRLHAGLRRTRQREITLDGGLGRLALETPEQSRQAYKALRTVVKSLPHGEAMDWVDAVIRRLGEVPPLNRVLSWEALRGLAREGVSVCSHGRDHALMTRLNETDLMADLTESLARMQAELGPYAGPPVLAYPSSASNEAVRQATACAGYSMAFGGQRMLNRLPLRDPREMCRLPAMRHGFSLFRAQLRPSVSLLGRLFFDLRERMST